MDLWLPSFTCGLISSLHCAGMCGPLAACSTGGLAGIASYHGARLLAYATAGSGAAALGGSVLGLVGSTTTSWVALAMAVGLTVSVLWSGRAPAWCGGWASACASRSLRLSPWQRAAMLGAVTPLLPCGLLWTALAGATASGHAASGLIVMLAFGVGSLPGLGLTQVGWRALHRRFGHANLVKVQRLATLGAAAVLLWRGIGSALGSSCCS